MVYSLDLSPSSSKRYYIILHILIKILQQYTSISPVGLYVIVAMHFAFYVCFELYNTSLLLLFKQLITFNRSLSLSLLLLFILLCRFRFLSDMAYFLLRGGPLTVFSNEGLMEINYFSFFMSESVFICLPFSNIFLPGVEF